MTLTFANKALDDALSTLDTVLLVTQEVLKDKSFPLEDRWALYLKAERALPMDCYISNAISILSDCLYDDLYMERYATSTNSEIVQRIVENYDEDEGDKYSYMYERLDLFREAVLQEGYGGFTNDW